MIEKKLAYFGLGSCVNDYDKNSYKGHAKLGKTYTINNQAYTPETDPNYEEVGQASWYGDDFHCNKTANGEKFNKWQLSAAHRTLPMPSVAEVTNLHNGKKIKVIVNDRGPFAGKNRIIDLSEGAAEKLGFKNQGVAKVKVKFLAKDTKDLVAKLSLPEHIFFAENKPYYKEKSYLEEEDSSLSKLKRAETTQKSPPKSSLVATIHNKRKAIMLANKLAHYGNVSINKDKKTQSYNIFLAAMKGKKELSSKEISTLMNSIK